ncbi:unnamed protein product, partial [Polarella glacialis]
MGQSCACLSCRLCRVAGKTLQATRGKPGLEDELGWRDKPGLEDEVTVRLAGNGISLRQLLDLYAELRACGKLSKGTKTWQFVRDFVIPETTAEACCFMESSLMRRRGGPTQPQKLNSHWWGADLCDTILSATQDASGLVPSDSEEQ